MPSRGYFSVSILIGMLMWHGAEPSALWGQTPAATASQKPPEGVQIGAGGFVWGRGDAVTFGFNQLAKLIDYVFVAALAMLGLVVKTYVFDRMNTKPNEAPAALTFWERLLVSGAIIFLGLSATIGLVAYGYLPLLITAKSFSLNDPLTPLVWIQEALCGAGMVFIGLLCLCA